MTHTNKKIELHRLSGFYGFMAVMFEGQSSKLCNVPNDEVVNGDTLISKSEARANAERIVSTWNAHDELVNNLKMVTRTLEFYNTQDNVGRIKDAIRISKTLLKSLEK